MFAVVALFLLKFAFGLFGFVFGIVKTLLMLALIGFVIYLILKMLSPGTADRVKDMIDGNHTPS